MPTEVVIRDCASLDEFLKEATIKSYTESGEFDVVLADKYKGTHYVGETQHIYDVRHKFVSKVVGEQTNIVVRDVIDIALESKGEIGEWLSQEMKYLQKQLAVNQIRTEIQPGNILKVYSAKDDIAKKLEA